MKKIIFIFSLFFSVTVFSQLQVNFPTQLTPSQLVQNVLLGSNVTATNITFNGSAANATVLRDQAGGFSTNFSPTNLGLQSGVLLTTGQTSVALGPNNDSSADLVTANPAFTGDSDISILSGRPIADVRNSSILEFDFVATGETLNFDFIFASEEYPVYSENPLFNDSFGFFLSGPGIAGPFSGGARNIALVPSTNIPVSIATINNGTNNDGSPCVNCALYYNNTNIGVNPTTWTGQTTQYNGFTTVLTANATLQCGQTYHIKLAIANIGDNAFDSAVFLKAGSFNVIPLNLGADLTNSTGSGVCDGGSVTLATGLPITYSFTWKRNGVVLSGQNGPSLTVTTPGTYEVSATTPSGCPLTPDSIIVEFKPPIVVGLPQNLTVCDTATALETFNLATNTPLVLAALTPVSDYVVTYHTSQLDADNDINPIPNAQLSAFQSAGQTIYVRVTDFELCFKVQSFTLNVITNPSGTISYSGSAYCSDITTPQTVTSTVPSGGTYSATPAGLNINPTTGAINPSLSTFGTTYTVTYSLPASGSCPAYSTNAIVTINPIPATPTFTNTQPTCTVGTGSITFTSPLIAGLEYSINNGTSYQSSPLFATVPPGPYTLIVRNTTTLCTSNTATVTINPALGVPATPVAIATQQPTCTTPTGTITVTAPTGANLEYSNNAGAYQTGLTFTGLAPGSSNIISVRDTTTGCVASASAIIINAIPANPAAPTASVTVQPTCPTPTGTIVISAPTGAAFEYSINGTTYQAGTTFASLVPATYNVTVRDTNTGCVSAISVQTVNSVPGAPVLPTANLTQPTCTTNTGSISITNVAANLEYSINSGAYSTTATFNGLAAGSSYAITVRNTITGCTSVQNFVITPALNVPTAPTASFSQPNCNTPTVTLTVSSTGSNLEYSNNAGAFQSSNVFAGLAPGSSNTIIVRNSVTGCTATAPAFVAPAITPNPAEVVASASQPNCITPTSTITITPPTTGGPYQYSNNGSPFQSGLTFAGLAPGSSNTIVVRDMTTGCVSTGIPAINVPAITANPAAPTASVTVQPTCPTPTGTIVISAPTGAAFEYSINGTTYQAGTTFASLVPATYNVTVRDTNTGCVSAISVQTVNPVPGAPALPTANLTQPTCTTNTGSISITNVAANLEYSINSGAYSTTATFNGLAAGSSYAITVRNTITGCTSVQNFVITPALNVPTAPTASFSQPNCNTPTVTLTVSSTGSNLEYSNNAGAFQSSNVFAGLAPGSSNTIIVRNSVTGCTATAPAFVAPAITPNPAEVVASASQPNCITPTSTITITPPTTGGPYQYSNNGSPFQSGLTFAGLAPGSSNTIVVRDMTTGCVSTGIPAINIPAITANPAVPTASVTVQPTCTIQTATIVVSPAFGTGFQYSINGGTSYQSSPIFTNVTANSNQVITVQNISTGCINTSLPIPVNPIPPIPATPTALGNNVCVGDTINLTTATVAGATYNWSGPNGFTSTDQNPIITNATIAMSGNYSVIVRLVADCPSLAGTISITVNPIPVVSLEDGYVCVDQNNVVLNTYTLDTQLSSSDYSFQWYTIVGTTQTPIAVADGGTGSSYTASAPGSYGVIVTSTSTTPNCPSQLITAQVGKSSPPVSFVATPSNYFAELQTITVNNVLPAGGTYEYQLDNGGYQTSNVFNNVGSGEHTIDVRDINKCGVVSNTVTIIDYPRYFTPNGDGYHDTWNISALNNQPNAKIYIFDRFGKLIKEITPSTNGWDGNFNGQPLPSTDYWFTLFYEENKANKEFKSHFAIKR